ncbi:unnamed protein product [Lactuca saligna]|uniref:Uncharacterized protein n=1 Tax=Lactuca saligna TaxID=75948 RepID=A0AA35YS36_LACSI|nr:unnamed protein product [Lactuca saligna]
MGEPKTNQSMIVPLPLPTLKATSPRPTPLWKKRRALLKQLSLSESPRNVAWERRRRLNLIKEKKKKKKDESGSAATDELSEDLKELKGCLELGFGFNDDEGGQRLTNTLPALDIYFAVNRLGSPNGGNVSPGPKLAGIGSLSSKSGTTSFGNEDPWKICSPGEDPQQVKAKLRHWAQAVACSVIQSS